MGEVSFRCDCIGFDARSFVLYCFDTILCGKLFELLCCLATALGDCILFRKNACHNFLPKKIFCTVRIFVCSVIDTPYYFVRTSSIARRITSASVMPSLWAWLTIHLCWDWVRTICRWMPFTGTSCLDERTSNNMYCGVVKC